MPTGYRKDGTKIIPPSSKGKKWPNRKPWSKEARKRASETHKRIGSKPPPWKGPRPNLQGENNPNWKGGRAMQTKRRLIIRAGRPISEQCEICGSFGGGGKKGLCYDHDHQTDKFRGWICARCNSALGFVKDNTETLQAMINYLLKNRG